MIDYRKGNGSRVPGGSGTARQLRTVPAMKIIHALPFPAILACAAFISVVCGAEAAEFKFSARVDVLSAFTVRIPDAAEIPAAEDELSAAPGLRVEVKGPADAVLGLRLELRDGVGAVPAGGCRGRIRTMLLEDGAVEMVMTVQDIPRTNRPAEAGGGDRLALCLDCE